MIIVDTIKRVQNVGHYNGCYYFSSISGGGYEPYTASIYKIQTNGEIRFLFSGPTNYYKKHFCKSGSRFYVELDGVYYRLKKDNKFVRLRCCPKNVEYTEHPVYSSYLRGHFTFSKTYCVAGAYRDREIYDDDSSLLYLLKAFVNDIFCEKFCEMGDNQCLIYNKRTQQYKILELPFAAERFIIASDEQTFLGVNALSDSQVFIMDLMDF